MAIEDYGPTCGSCGRPSDDRNICDRCRITFARKDAEIDQLRTERDEARALLRRIRAWDHLETAADGPYWQREIDAATKRWDEESR